MIRLTDLQLDAIRQWNTCTVSDAIETFDLRLRNEGYTAPGLRCVTSQLPPILGYAATSRVKTENPPLVGNSYYDRTDWWDSIEGVPTPRVAAIQDIDSIPGRGSAVGQAHAAILKALKCEGIVTNGSVRDLSAVSEMKFSMFAVSLSVSHSYMHMVDFGQPVTICGLPIRPGDLLYGDCHGIVSIPIEIAAEVPQAAAEVLRKKRRVVDFCQSPDFSTANLRKLVQQL